MGQTQTAFFLSLILLLSCVGCARETAQQATALPSPTAGATSTVPPTSTDVGITATVRATTTVTPIVTPLLTPTPAPTPAINRGYVSQPENLVRPQPDAQSAKRVAIVPILMYHYISVPPKTADRVRLDLSVIPNNFEDQLKYLAAYSYTTVSLYDVYNNLSTGAPLPPRPIVLTFDDGYRDAYQNAFPLLKKYHMTGTFFIISDFISSGNPAYMSWDMIKEMSGAGMSIESHTRSHPDLRNRSNAFLVYQILGPVEAITTYTGKRPHFFCYPSGKFDDAVIRVLRSVDTWAAVTTELGDSHTMAGAMTWTRVRVHGTTTLSQFQALAKVG